MTNILIRSAHHLVETTKEDTGRASITTPKEIFPLRSLASFVCSSRHLLSSLAPRVMENNFCIPESLFLLLANHAADTLQFACSLSFHFDSLDLASIEKARKLFLENPKLRFLKHLSICGHAPNAVYLNQTQRTEIKREFEAWATILCTKYASCFETIEFPLYSGSKSKIMSHVKKIPPPNNNKHNGTSGHPNDEQEDESKPTHHYIWEPFVFGLLENHPSEQVRVSAARVVCAQPLTVITVQGSNVLAPAERFLSAVEKCITTKRVSSFQNASVFLAALCRRAYAALLVDLDEDYRGYDDYNEHYEIEAASPRQLEVLETVFSAFEHVIERQQKNSPLPSGRSIFEELCSLSPDFKYCWENVLIYFVTDTRMEVLSVLLKTTNNINNNVTDKHQQQQQQPVVVMFPKLIQAVFSAPEAFHLPDHNERAIRGSGYCSFRHFSCLRLWKLLQDVIYALLKTPVEYRNTTSPLPLVDSQNNNNNNNNIEIVAQHVLETLVLKEDILFRLANSTSSILMMLQRPIPDHNNSEHFIYLLDGILQLIQTRVFRDDEGKKRLCLEKVYQVMSFSTANGTLSAQFRKTAHDSLCYVVKIIKIGMPKRGESQNWTPTAFSVALRAVCLLGGLIDSFFTDEKNSLQEKNLLAKTLLSPQDQNLVSVFIACLPKPAFSSGPAMKIRMMDSIYLSLESLIANLQQQRDEKNEKEITRILDEIRFYGVNSRSEFFDGLKSRALTNPRIQKLYELVMTAM
jgi:Mg2+ and Co2+ transporter CorA